MKHVGRNRENGNRKGYVSLLGVLTISIFMLTLMLFAYKRALSAQGVQADIQTQTDYREKEETILRSIVAITPNRAILAMQDGSDSSDARRSPLEFKTIIRDALLQSNTRQSISPELQAKLNIPVIFNGNSGDSSKIQINKMFKTIANNSGNVTGGLNRDLGAGYPPALNSSGAVGEDDIYPIITSRKIYGGYANGRVGLDPAAYPNFNLIPYPNINFGYAKPGQPFVAKRNWWAFTMDLADQDDNVTKLARFKRELVLSIYEIPSQLPISAGSFMALGAHANGETWNNVTISGNVFAGKVNIEGSTSIPGLATRRGSNLSADTTIGGHSFAGNPFAPGIRENFRITEGDFFPISLSSESGKAAFVPINRAAGYFDRFAHVDETATLSPTTWNDYSVGARQCAMQLDVTRADVHGTPTRLRFRYYDNGIRKEVIKDYGGEWTKANMPPLGYVDVADENDSVTFNTPHDLAYGKVGAFAYIDNFTGTVTYNNDTFGDPLVGTRKRGFARPVNHGQTNPSPFEFQDLPTGKKCIAVMPERIPQFLALLGADGVGINNSIVVNVDYISNNALTKPSVPCAESDLGVILSESSDMTPFTKGFSIVTNLRLHFGDDFNTVEATPPAGYTPPSGKFFPPCSIFAPEKRYGVDFDPFSVVLSGQVGSAAEENTPNPVRPLDATGVSGLAVSSDNIEINLSTITHPAELPPIFMMNWLILLEEKRKEFD